MPLTRRIADAFGVVTVCLVLVLALLGLLCILYSVYFRHWIRKQRYSQLGYFNKPWIIRIALTSFAIWWGFSEILRLSLLRGEERRVHAFNPKWDEAVCKFYIVSNLGFAEPCLFLTILFLLRASLKQKEFGAPYQKWNWKTACYIILWCLPAFIFQLIVVVVGTRINDRNRKKSMVPQYFTTAAVLSVTKTNTSIVSCTYPLVSTIFLGLYATIITLYLLWLGRRMLSSVINKGLRRRVLFLIVSVSSFFPLRVLLLGLSVLSHPGQFSFEALVFTAFLVLLCCAGLSICMLVYCPVADSLALKGMRDLETGRRPIENHHDAISLIGNQSLLEASSTTSAGRNSEDSTKRGSISFRTMLKDENTSAEVYEELSVFSPLTHHVASPPPYPTYM